MSILYVNVVFGEEKFSVGDFVKFFLLESKEGVPIYTVTKCGKEEEEQAVVISLPENGVMGVCVDNVEYTEEKSRTNEISSRHWSYDEDFVTWCKEKVEEYDLLDNKTLTLMYRAWTAGLESW